MTAYYNEHDPFAAAWLRELIADNLIAPGEVDERSIEDVTPDDLRSFQQCHFFAGIGVWSLAARRAGIPDDAPLWSGSAPCQPFSAAGKGGGFADERHLWPAFHYLVEQCEPEVVVGEQVTGIDGDIWLDLVSADLDATGYAFGAAETVAAGFGAPHKRSRNYWVAIANRRKSQQFARSWARAFRAPGWRTHCRITRSSAVGELADIIDNGQRKHGERLGGASEKSKTRTWERERIRTDIADGCSIGSMADLDGGRCVGIENGERSINNGQAGGWIESDCSLEYGGSLRGFGHNGGPGPTNGYWRDVDWLRCRDERWRPVEPDTFPLANAGTFRNRVGLLRGAGNAITLGQAEGFLRAVIASLH